eukprot:SAG31_NODE_768_length_12226_cov_3.928424_2_plen_162_part_00
MRSRAWHCRSNNSGRRMCANATDSHRSTVPAMPDVNAAERLLLPHRTWPGCPHGQPNDARARGRRSMLSQRRQRPPSSGPSASGGARWSARRPARSPTGVPGGGGGRGGRWVGVIHRVQTQGAAPRRAVGDGWRSSRSVILCQFSMTYHHVGPSRAGASRT